MLSLVIFCERGGERCYRSSFLCSYIQESAPKMLDLIFGTNSTLFTYLGNGNFPIK